MHYFLGIDGGASKTRAILITDTGTILAHESGAGSSIVGHPHPTALETLGGMARTLCARAGIAIADIAMCGLGLNGIDFADEIPDQHATLAEDLSLPAERLVLVNDGIVALWGASSAPAAAILQHGSAFTGGYRTRFGDETLYDHLGVGRVFDIRYELATLIARMLDGRAEPTPLLESALAHYGVAGADYAEALFRQRIPRDQFRGTASLIFTAWQAGDPAAESLVQCALDDYAITAKALVKHTASDSADIAFGGGVLRQAPKAFWEILAERVQRRYPRVTVKTPDLPPEYGAALMAAFHAGIPPAPLFTALQEASCETA